MKITRAQKLAMKLTELGIEQGVYSTFKSAKVQKRGGSREQLGDSINLGRRAVMDDIGRLLQGDEVYSMTEAYRVGIALFDGNCYLCGRPMYDESLTGNGIHGDHIIPHIHEGYGAAGNLLPTHAKCNDVKADDLYEDTLFYKKEVAEKIKSFQKAYNFKPLPLGTWETVRDEVEETMRGLSSKLLLDIEAENENEETQEIE